MKTIVNYEKDLNEQQLEAVKYFESPLLVLAGAGSGKTRVITYKIAYMIDILKYSPFSIMAVTFTNKASGEMKERVEGLLGEELPLWIKTFHSSAAKLLRIYGKELGVNPDFTIIDQSDQIVLVKNIVKEMNLDTDTYKPDRYVSLINRAKDRLLNVEKAFNEGITRDPVFYDIYEKYEDKLKKENLLDFGDLIFKLVVGLKDNDKVLDELKVKFQYLLIDEFQDTNFAQYEFVKLLSLEKGNICIVGDDDQSIYGFRGARVENVINFTEDFEDTKIIRLEENYRSFQKILTASSHLINKNKNRLGKNLYTKKGEGPPLVFYRAATDYYEAVFIAREIEKLINLYGYKYSDFAIFFRTNAQSRVFESVFSNYRIPYKVVGGFTFYEREEIKDVLAYLKLAYNGMDELSLRRVYNRPPRGIGLKTLEDILKASIEIGIAVYDLDITLISSSKRKGVEEFLNLLKEIKSAIDNMTPPDLIKYLYEETGYINWLEKQAKEEKIRNLEELYNAVEDFYTENPDASILDFIEEVSLDRGSIEEDFYDGSVYLITLHNAKGLEFPVVFMAGMEDKLFPHFLADENKDIQEERRLCYVGMTRAKERLYLTAAETRRLYGRIIAHNISPFIDEIPKELIVDASPVNVIEGDSSRKVENIFTDRTGVKLQSGKNTLDKKEYNGDYDFKPGDTVIHANFGKGKIIDKNDDIVTIIFDDGKRMKFMLKYTPLRKG